LWPILRYNRKNWSNSAGKDYTDAYLCWVWLCQQDGSGRQPTRHHHQTPALFLSGGIRTKLGRCSYNESFELEWSSYVLICAATKK
jgi:hypothetical protein